MKPQFRKIPHYLFHMSPASACFILLVTLLLLLPALRDLLCEFFQ